MGNLQTQEELVSVLNKGLVTIPKRFRAVLGLKPGSVVRVSQKQNRLYLEPVQILPKRAWRVYTDEEIEAFLKEDRLDPRLAARVDKMITKWGKKDASKKNFS